MLQYVSRHLNIVIFTYVYIPKERSNIKQNQILEQQCYDQTLFNDGHVWIYTTLLATPYYVLKRATGKTNQTA